MVGTTRQSGKTQAPMYSLTGRSKIGGFHEDLKKVSTITMILIIRDKNIDQHGLVGKH